MISFHDDVHGTPRGWSHGFFHAMDTPRGASVVAPLPASWTNTDRVLNGRAHETPHGHSPHREKCHDITIFHAV